MIAGNRRAGMLGIAFVVALLCLSMRGAPRSLENEAACASKIHDGRSVRADIQLRREV